jgi:hypothetical protein
MGSKFWVNETMIPTRSPCEPRHVLYTPQEASFRVPRQVSLYVGASGLI